VIKAEINIGDFVLARNIESNNECSMFMKLLKLMLLELIFICCGGGRPRNKRKAPNIAA